eukprot:3728931-Rhodomonas_salina.2
MNGKVTDLDEHTPSLAMHWTADTFTLKVPGALCRLRSETVKIAVEPAPSTTRITEPSVGPMPLAATEALYNWLGMPMRKMETSRIAA